MWNAPEKSGLKISFTCFLCYVVRTMSVPVTKDWGDNAIALLYLRGLLFSTFSFFFLQRSVQRSQNLQNLPMKVDDGRWSYRRIPAALVKVSRSSPIISLMLATFSMSCWIWAPNHHQPSQIPLSHFHLFLDSGSWENKAKEELEKQKGTGRFLQIFGKPPS